MSYELPVKPAQISYSTPETLDEALQVAADCQGTYEFVAGGTDAGVLRQQGLVDHLHTIDLTCIDELRDLSFEGSSLKLGSLVTLHRLCSSSEIHKNYPLLAKAAASVATPVIRKTATVGGNLLVSNRCSFYNQSKSWRTAAGSCIRDTGDTCLVTGLRNGKCFSRNVSDMAPALIALGAKVEIRNQQTRTIIPLSDLYVADGLKPVSHLDQDGILVSIQLSRPIKAWWYRKLRLRRSLDFTSLTIAAGLEPSGAVRICLNGVAMSPILIEGSLSELTLDDITSQARRRAKIVDNDTVPLQYRREMMLLYLDEMWEEFRRA